MVTKDFVKALVALDDAAIEAGGYLAPPATERREIKYDYRALMKYCRERGISPSSLLDDELERFRIQ